MSELQAQSRYNHPAYGRLDPHFRQLPMEPRRAAAFAKAVKAYARSIDARTDTVQVDFSY